MGFRNSLAPIGAAIAVFVVLQLVLIAADRRQTPVRTAEEFVRNYFCLDADMQEQLCTQIAGNAGAVEDHLRLKTADVVRRGFKPSYARRVFTKIHLDVLKQDETTAQIHVAGETRTSINRAMMIIGKWFHLGETYPVEMTLDLVKENGRWRVCGDALGQTI
jgi:hypothetical protein